MSRWLIGMSGDKDKMIEHLLKCEKQMVKRFAEIKEIVMQDEIDDHRIIEICDLYVDKRSDKQKMQDEIDELKEQLLNQQKIISGLMEGGE